MLVVLLWVPDYESISDRLREELSGLDRTLRKDLLKRMEQRKQRAALFDQQQRVGRGGRGGLGGSGDGGGRGGGGMMRRHGSRGSLRSGNTGMTGLTASTRRTALSQGLRSNRSSGGGGGGASAEDDETKSAVSSLQGSGPVHLKKNAEMATLRARKASFEASLVDEQVAAYLRAGGVSAALRRQDEAEDAAAAAAAKKLTVAEQLQAYLDMIHDSEYVQRQLRLAEGDSSTTATTAATATASTAQVRERGDSIRGSSSRASTSFHTHTPSKTNPSLGPHKEFQNLRTEAVSKLVHSRLYDGVSECSKPTSTATATYTHNSKMGHGVSPAGFDVGGGCGGGHSASVGAAMTPSRPAAPPSSSASRRSSHSHAKEGIAAVVARGGVEAMIAESKVPPHAHHQMHRRLVASPSAPTAATPAVAAPRTRGSAIKPTPPSVSAEQCTHSHAQGDSTVSIEVCTSTGPGSELLTLTGPELETEGRCSYSGSAQAQTTQGRDLALHLRSRANSVDLASKYKTRGLPPAPTTTKEMTQEETNTTDSEMGGARRAARNVSVNMTVSDTIHMSDSTMLQDEEEQEDEEEEDAGLENREPGSESESDGCSDTAADGSDDNQDDDGYDDDDTFSPAAGGTTPVGQQSRPHTPIGRFSDHSHSLMETPHREERADYAADGADAECVGDAEEEGGGTLVQRPRHFSEQICAKEQQQQIQQIQELDASAVVGIGEASQSVGPNAELQSLQPLSMQQRQQLWVQQQQHQQRSGKQSGNLELRQMAEVIDILVRDPCDETALHVGLQQEQQVYDNAQRRLLQVADDLQQQSMHRDEIREKARGR